MSGCHKLKDTEIDRNLLYNHFETKQQHGTISFWGAVTLFNIIILAYVATFRNDDHITPEFMFDALCLIAGGGLGLTVIEKIFDKRKEVPAPVQPAPEPQPEINYDNTPTEETV